MWRRVFRYRLTYVSEVITTSIFRLEDRSSRLLRNIGKFLPNYAASRPPFNLFYPKYGGSFIHRTLGNCYQTTRHHFRRNLLYSHRQKLKSQFSKFFTCTRSNKYAVTRDCTQYRQEIRFSCILPDALPWNVWIIIRLAFPVQQQQQL